MTDDATYRKMKQERDMALAECERLRTRHWTILDDMNKSELDAYDLGCAESIAAVDKILDGKDDGSGTNNEPWYTQRKRLLSLTAECERLKTALEIERMRLAGCGVAAMQNTEASKAERITKDNPYWSASYGDVCRAVDAEIEARENYLGACETIAKMHAAAVGEITGPIRGVVEDVVDVKLNLDLSLAECERLRADAERLDFVLANSAFIQITPSEGRTDTFQLLTQDEDENYIVMSGEDVWFPTHRAAIDAARAKP